MDCNLPGSSVHGNFQIRILKWLATPFSKGSSQLRDQVESPIISNILPRRASLYRSQLESHELYLLNPPSSAHPACASSCLECPPSVLENVCMCPWTGDWGALCTAPQRSLQHFRAQTNILSHQANDTDTGSLWVSDPHHGATKMDNSWLNFTHLRGGEG